MNADAVVDREFLDIRSKVLQIGASLDRIERAGGELGSNPKTSLLLEIIKILSDDRGERAERIQLACSRPYDPKWVRP